MRMNWLGDFLRETVNVLRAVGGSPQLRFLVLVVLLLLVVEIILCTIVFPGTSGLNRTILLMAVITIPLCLFIIAAIMIWKPPPPKEVKGVSADLVWAPTNEEKYKALFGGFTGKFYAFNPPFQVEEDKGSKQFEDALETHKKRYESVTTAHYLFFDRESLRRAKDFFEELQSKLGKEKFKKVLSIKFWDKEPYTPGYTFFLGEKGEDKPSCILYPSVVMSEGIPEVVVVIGSVDMYKIMHGHFNKYFAKAKKIKID